jgi:hypothetical protein
MSWYALWERNELAALTDPDQVSEVVPVEVHDSADCEIALKIGTPVVFSWVRR